MTKEKKRTEQERLDRADARLHEIPIPCAHCKHLLSSGTQFDDEGWTCEAYPEQIPYRTLTLRDPHNEPTKFQEGAFVYDPVIYEEEGTGKRWHYTADARWQYVDGA